MSSSTQWRLTFLGAVLLLSAAGSAAAQTVVGRVVDAETAEPMSGAFVVLEDPEGDQRGGVLAGETGRFVLRAPAPGRYRLVARFIGYADTATPFIELRAGETVERTIGVRVRAVNLEGIRAEVEQRCRSRPGGSGMAQVWEEAKKALQITDWTEAQEALQFRIVEHTRELDARTLRVTAMREQPRQGYYRESPYRSVSAEELAAEGYIQPAPGEQWDHYAPDAEVLLSDSFLDTHCFTLAEPAAAELIGLAFEPVPGRDLPDIAGVLWVDRGTAELKSLEFTYRNLPYEAGEWESVGGTVEFQRLATGMWVVRRWAIRMPLAATTEGGIEDAAPETRVLVSILEEGAEVREVQTIAGVVLAEAAGATVYGEVVDSMSGDPLDGAIVDVPAVGREAVTGPDGSYRLTGLPAGRYDVRIAHPDLMLLGGTAVLREVELEGGTATRVAASLDLQGRALDLCASTGVAEDPVVLYGRVRDPMDSVPVAGALVRVWSGDRQHTVVSDSIGGYALCLPRSDTLAVAAVGPGNAFVDAAALGAAQVPAPPGRVVLERDLGLAAGAVTASGRPAGSRPGRLIGTILRHDNRQPVVGAMVLVRDTAGRPVYSTVANADGQFRFQHPGGSTDLFEISVEHVAFGSVAEVVRFSSGELVDAEVILTERAIELDPIVVTQRRQGFLADMGLYRRIDQGAGMFIEREEIERRRPSRVTDLLVGRPNLRLVNAGPHKVDIRVIGAGTRMSGGDCQPAIYIDGNLARNAGSPRFHTTITGGVVYDSPFLSELVVPEEIEAIEIYTGPAGLPIQYGGSNADCGVVLIWTRR